MPTLCALLVAVVVGAGASQAAAPPSATLVVANREIVTFRATVAGNGPAERVAAALQRIEALPVTALEDPVEAQPMSIGDERGFAVLVGPRLAFFVDDGDRDPLRGDGSTSHIAAASAERLEGALRAWREQRTVKVLWRGAWQTALATLVLALALWSLVRLKRAIEAALAGLARRGADRVVRGRIDVAPVVTAVVRGTVLAAVWIGVVILVDVWITFVLGRFPLTAPWADVLTDRVLDMVVAVVLAALGAIPGLFAVAVILVGARVLSRFLAGIFDRVERGTLALPGVYPETVSATRRIVSALVWLLAVAAAYPYIPGSGSDAVRGLSLLVGVVVSLGSTGLMSQAMSGLALIYSRALAAGDVVRIGDVEGVVSEVHLLSTKIVTLPGVEVTFPNSVVLGGSVRNYTRLAGGKGSIVATSVTIGYDAPWRQVHALLLAAAAKTPGVAGTPPPFVLQRGLGDFYVEYQLLAHADGAPPDRPRVLSELHANVQDAFNAAGVQIMSPHFVLQPERPVLAPVERGDGDAGEGRRQHG